MSSMHPAPRFRPAMAVALTLIAVVSLAACSSSASPSTSSAGEVTTVTISGNSFGDDITIAAGSSVVFTNADGHGHTVTNGTDGVAVDSPLFDEDLAAGASTDPIVFDTPGTYDVTCKIHSSMHLTITVE